MLLRRAVALFIFRTFYYKDSKMINLLLQIDVLANWHHLSVAKYLDSGNTRALELASADVEFSRTGCFSMEAFLMFVFRIGGLGIVYGLIVWAICHESSVSLIYIDTQHMRKTLLQFQDFLTWITYIYQHVKSR